MPRNGNDKIVEREFLPYGRQSIDEDDINAVVETLRSDYLTTGPKVLEFEKKLKAATGCNNIVACGNGTLALHLACLAMDIKEGDNVIVPSLTFLATANAARYCGANVIFCDVDPYTGVITAETLRQTLNENPDIVFKAVFPVHLAGRPVDLKSIRKIADSKGMKIVADSCHALGGVYEGEKIGACVYEDFSTFSFHPVKTIATGEGGAIAVKDSGMALKMRSLRSHGMQPEPEQGPWAYSMQELGYNYRITDMQCALGISQLDKLNRFVEKRNILFSLYNELLKPLAPFILPPVDDKSTNVAWHLYSVRIDFEQIRHDRASLMMHLKENKIGSQVHYIPVHSQPYYQNLYPNTSCPGADQYYNKTLSLPLFPNMSEGDIVYVVDTLKKLVL